MNTPLLSQTEPNPLTRGERRIAFLVAALLFACYLLTYTGLIQSSDGLAMFAATESIARRGEVDTNQLLWMGLQQGSFGPDGELYSRKGLGMTLLALPLVWLARLWPAVGLTQTALLLNPLLTAWTGGLLYLAVVRLGWSRFAGIATALAYGLATLAWPYTQTFFSDPLAGWGLFAALYWLLAFQQEKHKHILVWAGLAWGLAYLSRSINLVTLPVYGLALAALLAEEKGTATGDWRLGTRLPARRLLFAVRRSLVADHLREWILFASPILAAGLLSLWWNWLRFGNLLDSGYVESEVFNGDWLFGLVGLLVSPGRGILWYSPVLLLVPLGIGWFWRRGRWLLISSGVVALLYWLLYAKWYMWHGGYSWGPRFLVPVLPFLMLVSAPAWQWIFAEERWGRAGRFLATFLVLLSLAVQWLGMLIPFSLVQDWLDRTVKPLFAPETFTHLPYSPLLRQWEFVNSDSIVFAWWRLGDTGPDWFALALLLGALIGGGLLLGRSLRPEEEVGERVPVALYAIAMALVALVLLVRFQIPASGLENSATAAQIAAGERPGDAILHLRPLETQQFANIYHGRLPVYGLFPVDELSPSHSRLLDELLSRYHRLWVVPDFAPPERSGWERTLRGTVFLLADSTIPPDDRRLVLYAAAQEQPLTERGVGIRFGDPAWVRLNGYGLPKEVTPGGALLVALEWESLRPVTKDYRVFVHLLDASGTKLAQRDGQPVLWLRPTSGWQPGERIVDRYGLLLPADLPPGEYSVTVGLYDPETGERQPSSAGPGDFAIQLGPVRVEGGESEQ
ncbi:MAG: hypothetical protein HY328_06570 [Chloroflexi bacterium]|nr:hypothetical protein [Chloroflexota bacterium]